MKSFESKILKKVVEFTAESTDNTLLGNVLAIGSQLVASGKLPDEVINSEVGHYALCLAIKPEPIIRILTEGDKIEVGRQPNEGGWEIDDPWLSRHHFTLEIDSQEGACLNSQTTKNGTFVNDSAISGTTFLKRGDVIRAGNTSFILL